MLNEDKRRSTPGRNVGGPGGFVRKHQKPLQIIGVLLVIAVVFGWLSSG